MDKKIEKHQEICDSLRKWANAIAREGVYSNLSVYMENRYDDKITYVFSLTPAKKEVGE